MGKTRSVNGLVGAINELMAAKRLNPRKWNDKIIMAGDLWEMAGPQRPPKKWSGVYLQNVITGAVAPSSLFVRAVERMGAGLDSVPLDLVKAQEVVVMNLDGALAPGTLIIRGRTRRCAYPPCGLKFLPNQWNHHYHSIECKRAHQNMKRREQR